MCNKFTTILQSISCEDDSPLQKLQIGALAFFGLQLRDAVSRFSRITIAKVTSFPGFSRTRPYEERERERGRERERRREAERDTHPGWVWSRGSRTKLILREESFVSQFCVLFTQ